MENKYGLYSPGNGGRTWLKNEEFQEEDVWRVLQEIQLNSISKPTYTSGGLRSPARSIPNTNNNNNKNKNSHRSAPLTVPDWSKIYGTSSLGTYPSFWLDTDPDKDENNRGFARNRWNSDIEEEDYDEGEIEGSSTVIPPHIWIAQRLRPSSSVCEGAGRTLKGRDLLSVRNAVLTKTGFLESKSNLW